MKKSFALLLVLFAVLSTCCAPKPIGRAPDVTSRSTWRDFELVLHVDEDFTAEGRARITRAADAIRRLTHDRARLSVVFDLDFDSVIGLQAHKSAHHSCLIGVTSDFPVVATIDEQLGGPRGTPLAVTIPENDGSVVVLLILDRMASEDFESIVMHELGHVIGFPDLPVFGAVMSGAQISGVRAPKAFTDADVELCRSLHYCD